MPRLSSRVAASGGGRRASRGGHDGPPLVTDGQCARCFHGRRRLHREPPPARPPVTGGRLRRGRGLRAAWLPTPHPRSRRRWRNRRRRRAAAPYSGGATVGSGGGGGGGGGGRRHRPLSRRRPRARSALRDYSFGVTPLQPRGAAAASFWRCRDAAATAVSPTAALALATRQSAYRQRLPRDTGTAAKVMTEWPRRPTLQYFWSRLEHPACPSTHAPPHFFERPRLSRATPSAQPCDRTLRVTLYDAGSGLLDRHSCSSFQGVRAQSIFFAIRRNGGSPDVRCSEERHLYAFVGRKTADFPLRCVKNADSGRTSFDPLPDLV